MKKEKSQQDFYTKKAKEEGFPARSVFKLKELDERFSLFKRGDRVLDLGSAPGSWLLYISEKIGDEGKAVGVDLNPLNIDLPKNCSFLEKDIDDLSLGKFNTIVSDLAPKTSGLKERDSALSLALCQKAFLVAKESLLPRGSFACKVFESPEVAGFVEELKPFFKQVQLYKTKATLKGSREAFIVCLDFN